MIDTEISAEDPEHRPRAAALAAFDEWLDSSRSSSRANREGWRGALPREIRGGYGRIREVF